MYRRRSLHNNGENPQTSNKIHEHLLQGSHSSESHSSPTQLAVKASNVCAAARKSHLLAIL